MGSLTSLLCVLPGDLPLCVSMSGRSHTPSWCGKEGTLAWVLSGACWHLELCPFLPGHWCPADSDAPVCEQGLFFGLRNAPGSTPSPACPLTFPQALTGCRPRSCSARPAFGPLAWRAIPTGPGCQHAHHVGMEGGLTEHRQLALLLLQSIQPSRWACIPALLRARAPRLHPLLESGFLCRLFIPPPPV